MGLLLRARINLAPTNKVECRVAINVYFYMKYVQIYFDDKLLNIIDNIAVSSRLSRSAVVRQALRYWIRQKEIQAFEDDWNRKLREHPPDNSDTDAWMDTEHWGEI